MTLIIARHGQTYANVNGIIQGWTNTDLTEKGVKETKILAEKISSIKPKKIYCSDLERAKKTSEIYNKKFNAKIKATKKAREIFFGEWEGKKIIELEKTPEWQEYQKNRYSFNFPKGESFKKVKEKRAKKFLEKIMPKNNETVMFIGHYGFNICLLGELFKKQKNQIFEIKMPNNLLYIIDFGSGALKTREITV